MGILWLSTLRGISRFDPQSGTFRNYDANDGLQGDIFNPAAYNTSQDMILLGGQNGLTSFYPEDLQENPHLPPVRLTGFSLTNEPVVIGGDSPLQQSIVETEELELTYNDRVISFEFAALNYSSPQKNRYRYMLEGFDEQWIEVGSDRRFVTYTNLDPGAYVLKVIGSNNDGVWNEEGTSISITITPAWWQTWLFRGGVILLLVGLVAGGFVWQRESGKRRERYLETQVVERTRALSFAQEQISALFETAHIGIGLATLEGKILVANEALLQMMGYSEEEMLQRNVTGFYVDLGQRDDMLERLSRSKAVNDFGVKLKRNNGSSFFANVNVSIVIREEQEIILAMVENVTERKRAEEALRKSEEEYRNLVEKISDIIYVIDLDGVITYLNPAIESLLGLPSEEVVGQPFAQFVHTEDLGRLQDNVQNLLSGTSPRSADYRVLNTSGETRWIRTTSQPIIGEDGVTGLQGVLTDITERRIIEGQLEEAASVAERDRLARRLHDAITQTLFSASVMAEAAPRVWSKDPTQAQRNMEQLAVMLRGAMAEMRTMVIELRPAAVSGKTVGQLLQTLVEANQPRINGPVSFVVEGDRILPENVTIAFYRIAQEAFHNAAQHADATEVDVKVVFDQEGVILNVRDNGRGFDQNMIPAGHFGLNIMAERIEEVGGNLVIESEPGTGTEVIASWSERGNEEES
jgi:PAS domain S-box-containing protein